MDGSRRIDAVCTARGQNDRAVLPTARTHRRAYPTTSPTSPTTRDKETAKANIYPPAFPLPKSFSNKPPLDAGEVVSIGGAAGEGSALGWWVNKWVACRRQWSRSSRRSPVVCSRWRISRSRCLIFSSKSSVLESLCGVSFRSVVRRIHPEKLYKVYLPLVLVIPCCAQSPAPYGI